MARKFRILLSSQRHQMSPIWLTVFSDLMTNLMLFFLMLWGLTRLESEKQAQMMRGLQDSFRGGIAAVETRAEKVLQRVKEEDSVTRMESFIKDSGLEKYAKVEISEKQVRLTLNVPVLFAVGEAKLTSEAESALDEVAKLLKTLPNDILVEGHTDNLPITGGPYPSNWELSIARAFSVIDYFISQGISPERIIAAGYGEYHPLYPNDTPEHRGLNRRIEINILRRTS